MQFDQFYKKFLKEGHFDDISVPAALTNTLKSKEIPQEELGDYTNSEHQVSELRALPKGEYIRFKPNGPVYIRDEYSQEQRKYYCVKDSDASVARLVNGKKLVYHGFTW